jgi:3'-5' exoribonuclease
MESTRVVPKDAVTLNDIPTESRRVARAGGAGGRDAPHAGEADKPARTCWIGSLTRGEAVDAVFLLRRCDLRHTRSGLSYLAVELQDRTGVILGRHWLGGRAEQPQAGTGIFFGATPAPPELGSLVLERLRASPYVRATGIAKRAEPESGERAAEKGPPIEDLHVELSSIAPCVESTIDLRELYEHTPADTDGLLVELRRTFEAEVEDAWVRRLLLSFLDDPVLVSKLRAAPAASSFHHAYVGGLLEHIASLTQLTLKVCEIYPRLDRSLMLAGIFLHDVGKVDELSWERGLQYTDRGQLLGHIAIGVLMLDEKIRAIPGFPPRLRDLLQHLVLSHHGTKEFGSPVLPVTPEALAVHHLDNLDGKLWSAFRAIDDPRGDPSWSPHNRHLGRKIFRGPVSGEPD